MRYLTKSQKKYFDNICTWVEQKFYSVPPRRNKIPTNDSTHLSIGLEAVTVTR